MSARLKLLLLLAMLACSALVGATTPVISSWTKLFDAGERVDDKLGVVGYDKAGSEFLCVSSYDETVDVDYMHVDKFDHYGNLIWTWNAFFFGRIAVNAIAVDPSDCPYVTGGSEQSAYIIKFSAAGAFDWVQTYRNQNAYSTSGMALGFDTAGDVEVACQNFNLSFGGGGQGDLDYLQYSSSGVNIVTDEETEIIPTDYHFMQNGDLLVAGGQSAVAGPIWELFDSGGASLGGQSLINTTGTENFIYGFTIALDASDNVVILTSTTETESDILLSQTFTASYFDSSLNDLWTAPAPFEGLPLKVVANDPAHLAIWSSNGIQYLGAGGAVEWTKFVSGAADLAIDTTHGVAVISTTGSSSDYGILVQKYLVDGTPDWSTKYGPAPSGTAQVQYSRFIGTVLRLAGLQEDGATGEDILLLNYAEGVALSSLSLPATTITGAGELTGTVTLDAPAPSGGISVNFLSASPTVLQVPASVVVPSGQTHASFAISASPVDSAQVVRVNGTANGVERYAYITLEPSPLSTFQLGASSVKGGVTVDAKVTLSGKAGSSGRVITLHSNSGSAIVPSTVTIPSGQTSVAFQITTKTVTANISVSLTAASNGVTKATTLTLTP